jgi:hypothetical protein
VTTAAEKLIQINLKTKRAKKHIADLNAEFVRFRDSYPYKVGAKKDAQRGKLIYYVLSVEDVPDTIPPIIGDILQNLRSALDHMAYQLVCSNTGGKPVAPEDIFFPIFWAAPKDETVIEGKVKGASAAVAQAIFALKPYKGGNGDLWMLHRLNNIDKHRFILTAGSQAAGVSLGGMMRSMPGIPAEFNERIVKAVAGLFINPADNGFPLKAGFELLITDGEPDQKPQFRFEVALNEPGIVEGKPLIETINQLATTVDNIIDILKPFLRDTP